MSSTTDYINFFNNSLQNKNLIQRDPSAGDSMDWKGLGLSMIDPATKAIKGADSAIKLNNAYNTFAPFSLMGKTATPLNNASKLSVGLKGAGKALGGTVGVGNLAVTAASFLPGAKEADYSTTAEKSLKLGSTAVGLGAAGAAALGLGAAALGPVGLALGAGVLASNLAGKTAKKHSVSAQDTLQNVGSGYGNLNEDIKAAGKKFSFFRRKDAKKVNRNIRNIDQDRMQAADIGYTNKQNTIAGINSIGDIQSKNQQSLVGGLNTNILAAKKGIKIKDLKEIKNKVNRLQKGGKVNVIPDGALHARKHNIELSDEITTKGIPVVSGDMIENQDGTLELQKGGEITQHAEIEREEIIFHKELTEKIESLYKEYESGDESAAIKVGKLLVYEILENTIDNTGELLNEN